MEKKCIQCSEEKDLSEFYPRMNTCKKCHLIRCREWALKNPTKRKQIQLRDNQKRKTIENNLRDGWKHRGIHRYKDRFYVEVFINGERKYIRNLKTKQEAIDAYFRAKGKTPHYPIIEGNIVKIPLSKWSEKGKDGKYTLVDLDVYEQLKDKNLTYATDGYARLGKKSLQSIIMGGMADHINGDRLDNRRCNLRLATRSENVRNSKKPFHTGDYHKNSSIYKGVMKRGDYKAKWRARITFNGKRISLGDYDDEIKAAQAYDKKAIELFGEFACINFPVEHRKAI